MKYQMFIFSPIDTVQGPVETNTIYTIGETINADKQYDIGYTSFMGICNIEKETDTQAKISLELNQISKDYLEEVLFFVRRGIAAYPANNFQKIILEENDQHKEVLQKAGWIKTNNRWEAELIDSNICTECNIRPATENYTLSITDFLHGNYEKLCEQCCLTKQIQEIEKSVERLPGLKAKLKEIM